MSISSNLRQELSNWASSTEIDDFENGDADLQVKLDPNNINFYHVDNGKVYKASMEFGLDHSTGDMGFSYPVDPSSEDEIMSDLNSASEAEITAEIGDWGSLLP